MSLPDPEAASGRSPMMGHVVKMDQFAGFRSGSRATIIPNAFFTEVLPQITDEAELIVSSYIFFALGRRRGIPRAVSVAALAAEPPLRQALARLPGGAEEALGRGLKEAVQRGTLIETIPELGSAVRLFLLNTEQARQFLTDARGPMRAIGLDPPAEPPNRLGLNIFALYEENIGSIPPLLVDDMREAEASYPASWIEAAFREAVALNRRNWRYIARILERWRLEGPTYEAPGRSTSPSSGSRRRSIAGPYRRIVE